MGNAMFNCSPQSALAIRVIQTDGEVLEIYRPITAKQLIKVYPGHMVLRCSGMSRLEGSGQRARVSIVHAEDTLVTGQTYCLLRIPNQSGKVLLPKASYIKSVQARNGSKNSKKVTPLRSLVLGSGTHGGGNCVRDSDAAQQLQYKYSKQSTHPSSPAGHAQLLQHQQHHQHQRPGGSWKPQLDAIVESPLQSTVPPRSRKVGMTIQARRVGHNPWPTVPVTAAANSIKLAAEERAPRPRRASAR